MPVTLTTLAAGIDTPTAMRRVPDTGELIVGTEDGRVLRIPAGGGEGIEVIQLSQEIRSLAVHEHAQAVAVCHGNRVVEVGLAAPTAVRLPPKLDAPSAVVIDGGSVLAAEGFAPGRLVSIESGSQAVSTIASAVISPVAVGVESPGGSLLVLSEYGQLSRIDRATGETSLVASGFDKPVDLVFAGSDRRSVLIAERGTGNILRLDLDNTASAPVVVVGGLRKLRAIDVVDATHLVIAAGDDILLAELEPGAATEAEPESRPAGEPAAESPDEPANARADAADAQAPASVAAPKPTPKPAPRTVRAQKPVPAPAPTAAQDSAQEPAPATRE